MQNAHQQRERKWPLICKRRATTFRKVDPRKGFNSAAACVESLEGVLGREIAVEWMAAGVTSL